MDLKAMKTEWELLKAESDRLEGIMWKTRAAADVAAFKAAWLKTSAARQALEKAESEQMSAEDAASVQTRRALYHSEMSEQAKREQAADSNEEK